MGQGSTVSDRFHYVSLLISLMHVTIAWYSEFSGFDWFIAPDHPAQSRFDDLHHVRILLPVTGMGQKEARVRGRPGVRMNERE